MQRFARLIAMAVALSIAALIPLWATGCAGLTLEDAHALRADAATLRDDTASRADQLAQLAASLPEGSSTRAEADAALAAARAKQAALDAAIARLDTTLAEAAHPTDGVTLSARALGAFLPEPLRLPLLLAGALTATLLRARQLKAGAASIAASIQKATQTDPDFSAALARHANTLRTIQTPTARRIVDQTTRPGTLVRLPI